MPRPVPVQSRLPFHYAWVIAAVTSCVLLLTAAVRATLGVLMVPLESEFALAALAVGVVLGALSAADATGQLLFLPMLARFIQTSGWRSAAWMVSGTAAAVFMLVSWLLRERPEDLNSKPFRVE